MPIAAKDATAERFCIEQTAKVAFLFFLLVLE